MLLRGAVALRMSTTRLTTRIQASTADRNYTEIMVCPIYAITGALPACLELHVRKVTGSSGKQQGARGTGRKAQGRRPHEARRRAAEYCARGRPRSPTAAGKEATREAHCAGGAGHCPCGFRRPAGSCHQAGGKEEAGSGGEARERCREREGGTYPAATRGHVQGRTHPSRSQQPLPAVDRRHALCAGARPHPS